MEIKIPLFNFRKELEARIASLSESIKREIEDEGGFIPTGYAVGREMGVKPYRLNFADVETENKSFSEFRDFLRKESADVGILAFETMFASGQEDSWVDAVLIYAFAKSGDYLCKFFPFVRPENTNSVVWEPAAGVECDKTQLPFDSESFRKMQDFGEIVV